MVVHEPQKVPARPIRPHGGRTVSSATPPQKIPANKYALRIGVDQSGKNTFRGQVGRASLLRGMLGPEAIRKLAATDRTKKAVGGAVLASVLNPKVRDSLSTNQTDFSGEITFEAWLRPAAKETGRIVDKLTPGQRDGFLIDCWPGLSVRVIIGPYQKDYPGVLKAGVWQHVAVTIGKGKSAVYVNGTKR